MLTPDQRNGVTDRACLWPYGIVPFVMDSVFSEYCRTKLQKCYAVHGGNYPEL